MNIREELVELYSRLAAHTLPECRSCRVPLSCCSAEYCASTIEHAKENWGVELTKTNHPSLPLMGPTGCTAAPHLRPMCTMHTCAVNSLGCKLGDQQWTEKYFELREQIETLEFELLVR